MRASSGGKEIRRSLRTTDRASAQRALAWLKEERKQVDPAQGKITLAELCDRYSETIQHNKPTTIDLKARIIRRIKSDWPTGRLTQVTNVKPSHVDLWISRYRLVLVPAITTRRKSNTFLKWRCATESSRDRRPLICGE